MLPSGARVRVYDPGGKLILDSLEFYSAAKVIETHLASSATEKPGFAERVTTSIRRWFNPGDIVEFAADKGMDYLEVVRALGGNQASMVRFNEGGRVVVSAAVPIQRFHSVLGSLMLTTLGGDIEDRVESERLSIVQVFLIVAGIVVLLSMLLARSISFSMRRGPSVTAASN
jgi:two-component system, OmpR family, sensor histidine kinase ChvG